MEFYLQQCRQRHIQEYISRNMNRHKPGNMILLSLLSVQDNIILPKWYEETTGIYFDCPADGHLNPTAAISIYGRRYQARHYCAYGNGLSCLFRLRAATFTLQLKIHYLCVSFWETNYRNVLQQVLCKL